MERRRASGEAATYVALIRGNRLAAERRWDEAAAAYEAVRRDHPDDPPRRARPQARHRPHERRRGAGRRRQGARSEGRRRAGGSLDRHGRGSRQARAARAPHPRAVDGFLRKMVR